LGYRLVSYCAWYFFVLLHSTALHQGNKMSLLGTPANISHLWRSWLHLKLSIYLGADAHLFLVAEEYDTDPSSLNSPWLIMLKGYETVLIASLLGLDTIGADISPTAVEVAKRYEKSFYFAKMANKFGFSIHSSTLIETPGKVTFKVLDFFQHAPRDDERYNLIFDYLWENFQDLTVFVLLTCDSTRRFFEAISPNKRKDWGSQMNALIKPGGFLVALIYPIDPETDLGPPFFVRPEHYTEFLGQGWTKVLDIIPTMSLASHVGRERLAVWRKDKHVPGVWKK
jgi:hypothetical protein